MQGGADCVCPPQTAWALHRAWPEMELRVVPAGGHSHYDAGLQTELLHAAKICSALPRPWHRPKEDDPSGAAWIGGTGKSCS